ncbi:MAG: hypothetical protein OHK0039_16220 [Bacteroidia bacterium]
MPIEIRELVIKTRVERPLKDSPHKAVTDADLRRLRNEVIETCMARMKDLLEDRLGR